MKDQITYADAPVLKILLSLVVIAAAVFLVSFGVYQFQHSDPYIQEVMSAVGDAERGHAIFTLNCSGCHGIYGDGQVGPSLHDISDRKSRLGLIHQVTSGETPPMPQFQPSPQEMADLLEYLESL